MLLWVTAGCDSPPATKSFAFDAIDTDENPVPCMIVVNDDWAGAQERSQFVNVEHNRSFVLEWGFPDVEIQITVAPLRKDGEHVMVPKSRKEARDLSGFQDEVRPIRRTDPERQLFILPKRAP